MNQRCLFDRPNPWRVCPPGLSRLQQLTTYLIGELQRFYRSPVRTNMVREGIGWMWKSLTMKRKERTALMMEKMMIS